MNEPRTGIKTLNIDFVSVVLVGVVLAALLSLLLILNFVQLQKRQDEHQDIHQDIAKIEQQILHLEKDIINKKP